MRPEHAGEHAAVMVLMPSSAGTLLGLGRDVPANRQKAMAISGTAVYEQSRLTQPGTSCSGGFDRGRYENTRPSNVSPRYPKSCHSCAQRQCQYPIPWPVSRATVRATSYNYTEPAMGKP